MDKTLKQLMLKAELEKRSVYGFMEIGIQAGKGAFSELISMFNGYKELEIEMQKAFTKQTIEIDGKKITINEAFLTKEFYEILLESSLQKELPDLYKLGMEDYLQLNQEIEAHLTSHTLKGKKKLEKKTKREETNISHSSAED